ncbi:MAG: aromatic ring-hydroxylating dioxygenase subunit alpha [Burkholderiales bacterium]|nr:aromatic ring-hydroxylating dioxygenase subunit alpha [Burkholderiales bacterium]
MTALDCNVEDLAPRPIVAAALEAALERSCAPLEQARTLPAEVFTSQRVFALEQRELFARRWLALARDEDFPQAGSFVTHELVGERVLIVRAEDGVLRAFYNVCRHRGARLVDEPRGCLRSAIRCPYHAWSYGFDGALRHAPRMDVASSAHDLGLAAMPLARHDGFVFVNLDARAEPLGALPRLEPFGLARLCRVRRLDYQLACNWKIVCENYSECYHCPGVHPQLARLADLASGGFESTPTYNGGPMALKAGVDTLSTSGRSAWAQLAAEAPPSRLVHYYLVYPNLMLGIHPDYLLVHRVWPRAPARSVVDCELFVAPEILAAPGFDPAGVIEFWDLTNRQDWALCERVQQGAASRGYRPGPYHASERCVHAFDAWYARAMGATRPRREARS